VTFRRNQIHAPSVLLRFSRARRATRDTSPPSANHSIEGGQESEFAGINCSLTTSGCCQWDRSRGSA
jgi:hypothetical protein